MKKIAIGLSLGVLALSGTAFAAQAWARGHDNDRTSTRAEALTRSEQLFARLDVNKDGKLDPADREARRAAAFDRIDANKDGGISRAEFTAMHAGMGGRGMAGDGDKSAMSGEHRMGGHRMGGHRRGGMMLMRMADSNKDGVVTSAEFTAAAATRFDTADTNRDGTLTPAERQAARGAMRERMQRMHQQNAPGGAAISPPSGN
jgi:EF hand